jgi:hypothetical protein
MDQINGSGIVLLLRDGNVRDLNGLAERLTTPSRPGVYARYDVRNLLAELEQAGLVRLGPVQPAELRGAAEDYGIPNVEVSLAPNWHLIQRSLGFSLTRLARKRDDTLEVNPYFGLPARVNPAPDVFVLMPFDVGIRPIYLHHIQKVAGSLNLVAMRADDFFDANHVMSDVWRGIYSSRVVIADCTGRNPNVFYEIGVAHTLGRPVILITQNAEDVPFDLRHIRFIHYQYTPPGMAEFESRLAATLETELSVLRARSFENGPPKFHTSSGPI